MFFAAIGDIRGNFFAFEAVLHAIDEAGIQVVMQTGNLVAGGENGARVVAQVRDAGLSCVQGGEDRDVIRVERKAATLEKRYGARDFAALQRAYNALPGDAIEWLGKLKRTRTDTLDGLKIVLCHGAPSTANLKLGPDTPVERLLREREIDAPDIVVSGGGEAFTQQVGSTFFVGVGPLAAGDGQAAYTLIDTESKPWRARECLVQYTEGTEQ